MRSLLIANAERRLGHAVADEQEKLRTFATAFRHMQATMQEPALSRFAEAEMKLASAKRTLDSVRAELRTLGR